MFATRITSRSSPRLGKSFVGVLCKPSATPSSLFSRSISSNNAYTSNQLRPLACTFSPHRTLQMRLSGSSSAIQRNFSATAAVSHGHLDPPKAGEELYITFVDKEGDEHKLAVSKGDNLLTIAQAHDIEMEGACEGSCACSTCHVIIENEATYDKIPEATDDENDMLDLAFGLTETSRLGCQIEMTPELNGLRVRLPSNTRNLQAKDFGTK